MTPGGVKLPMEEVEALEGSLDNCLAEFGDYIHGALEQLMNVADDNFHPGYRYRRGFGKNSLPAARGSLLHYLEEITEAVKDLADKLPRVDDEL
jgi:hypothetical protein